MSEPLDAETLKQDLIESERECAFLKKQRDEARAAAEDAIFRLEAMKMLGVAGCVRARCSWLKEEQQ